MSMKPHITLKRMLVHLKDKWSLLEKAGVVYLVCSKDCLFMYTAETERRYGMKGKEHKRDVKTLEKYTWARTKDLLLETHPLSITDHTVKENHTIYWEDVIFPTKDTDWTVRCVKEAVEMRKTKAHTMNRDAGCHQLKSLHFVYKWHRSSAVMMLID